jgi:dTDP-4-dehydrorhamnose reductase
LTLRTSIIGPQLEGDHGLLAWLLSKRGGEIRGYRRAIYSGVTTRVLAEVLVRLMSAERPLSGLYHLASDPISKLELLSHINEAMELDIAISVDEAVVCDRSLDGARFARASGIRVPSQAAMIEQLAEELRHDTTDD